MSGPLAPPWGRPALLAAEERRLARETLHEASAEVARLRRIGGPSRRTARRIARARERLAFAAALLGAPLAQPALARPPSFVSPVPFGLTDVGIRALPAFADLDDDGDLDAFVGEVGGDTIFFSNTGTASAPAFAPPATSPFGLADVGVLASPAFADLDGDGDLDAFVGESDGNTVFFQNTGTASAPAFAPPATNPFGLADVGIHAHPAFADLDGDDDLDAFVGEINGISYFFANTGTANAPAFAPPVLSPFADVGYDARSAFADLDGDGDLDALVGAYDGRTSLFENTGTASAPAFAPPVTSPFGLVRVGQYAAPAFVDLDGDADLDALVGESFGRTIFQENTGTASAPAFAPPVTDPFALADVGGAASPAFADLDGDGDFDAFAGASSGETVFFENTGTAGAPVLIAPVAFPFGLGDVGAYSSPAFADLDGDGDADALVGEVGGNTIFFENSGTASTPAFAAPATNPFGLADVGAYASPAFADLDGDGDLDALVGNFDASTILFPNTGTASAPAFGPPATNPFGLAAVRYLSSPAFADLDGDGDLDAFVGEATGKTIFFENTGTASAPAFAPPVANPFGLFDVGVDSAPTLADLDGDGDLDAFVGASDGGITFFENLASLCPGAPAPSCSAAFAKASLSVDERKAGKEKLAAKLAAGPELSQADFGDPTAANGTALALCVYGDAGPLAAMLEVDRAGDGCGSKPCWKPTGGAPPGGKGFAYKDAAGSSQGVRSLKLKGGRAGKSSLALFAANSAKKGQTALPTGIAAALAAATSVTLQVHTSEGGCFEATASEITKQEADRFKAK